MLGVRIESELEQSLDRYVKKSGESRSAVVKDALRQYLSDKLDQEVHDKLTLAAWKDIQKGYTVSEKDAVDYLKTWKSK